MKIALVHDYLSSFGGAEQVLSVLHEMYPQAPIYTIFSDTKPAVSGKQLAVSILNEKFGNAKIVASWFDKVPYRKRLMSPLLFLIPLIWRSFDFSDYDLVISSASWAVTKGFSGEKTKEICYCHTPPRYLYGYDTSGPWKKYKFVRIYAAICAHFMRIYDFKRAQKVTQFVANSREVQKRIEKFYRKESVVINPPVDLSVVIPAKAGIYSNRSRIKSGMTQGGYFLMGGRLVAAKNFDLIIQACNELDIALKVYGSGPEEESLKKIAGETIEFLGAVSEEKKFSLMTNCKAFIVAAKDEDFGITPVEAMSVGIPVIAYRGGGYTETVVEGKTGEFFDELSVNSLVAVLKNIKRYNPEIIKKHAEKFSKENFIKEFKKLVETLSSRTP